MLSGLSFSRTPCRLLWLVPRRRLAKRHPADEETDMVNLPTLTADQLADPDLRRMMEKSGDEMFGVFGHQPELFKAFLDFYLDGKFRGVLPFELKELVRLRIAELNQCHR